MDNKTKELINSGVMASSFYGLSDKGKKAFMKNDGCSQKAAPFRYALWAIGKMYGDDNAEKIREHYYNAVKDGTETMESALSKLHAITNDGIINTRFEDKFGDDIDYEQMMSAPLEMKRRMLSDGDIKSYSKEYLEGGIGEDWTEKRAKELRDKKYQAFQNSHLMTNQMTGAMQAMSSTDYTSWAHQQAEQEGVDLNYNRRANYNKRAEKIAKIRTDILDEAMQSQMDNYAMDEIDEAYVKSKINELKYDEEDKGKAYSKVIDTFGDEDEFTDIGDRNLYQAFKVYDEDIKNGVSKEDAIEKLDAYLIHRCEENQDWVDVMGDTWMSFVSGMSAGTMQLFTPIAALGYASTVDKKAPTPTDIMKGADILGEMNYILATGKTSDGRELPAIINNKYASDMMQYKAATFDAVDKARRNGMGVYQLLNSTGEINAAQIAGDIASVVGNMVPVIATTFVGNVAAGAQTAKGLSAMAQGAAGAAKAAKYAKNAARIGQITQGFAAVGGYNQTIAGEVPGVFDEYLNTIDERKQEVVGLKINDRYNELKENNLEQLTEQIYEQMAANNKDALPDQILLFNAQQEADEQLKAQAQNEVMNDKDVKKFLQLSEAEIIAFKSAAVQENALTAFKMWGMSPMLKYLYKAPSAFSKLKRVFKAANREGAEIPTQTLNRALKTARGAAKGSRLDKIKDLLGEAIDEGSDNIISTYAQNNAASRSYYDYDKESGELIAKFSGMMSVIDPGNVGYGISHAFDNLTENASGWYEAALGAFIPMLSHGLTATKSGIDKIRRKINLKKKSESAQVLDDGKEALERKTGIDRDENRAENGGVVDTESNDNATNNTPVEFTDEERKVAETLGVPIDEEAPNQQGSTERTNVNDSLEERGFTISDEESEQTQRNNETVSMMKKAANVVAAISSAMKSPVMLGNLLTTIINDRNSSNPMLDPLMKNESVRKQLQTAYGNTTMLDAINSMIDTVNQKVEDMNKRLGIIPPHCKTWVKNSIANSVADHYQLEQRGVVDESLGGLKILGQSSKIMSELKGVAKRFAQKGSAINSRINGVIDNIGALETIDFDTVLNDFMSYSPLQQAMFLATANNEQYKAINEKIGNDATAKLLDIAALYTDKLVNDEVAKSTDEELVEIADGLEALDNARIARSHMTNLIDFAVNTIDNFGNVDMSHWSGEEKEAYYNGVQKSIDIIRELEKHVNKNDERYKEFAELQSKIKDIETKITEQSEVLQRISDNDAPRNPNDEESQEDYQNESDKEDSDADYYGDEEVDETDEIEQVDDSDAIGKVSDEPVDPAQFSPSDEESEQPQKDTPVSDVPEKPIEKKTNEVVVTPFKATSGKSSMIIMNQLAQKLKAVGYDPRVATKVGIALHMYNIPVIAEVLDKTSGGIAMVGYYVAHSDVPDSVKSHILPEEIHDGKVFIGGELVKPGNISLGEKAMIKPSFNKDGNYDYALRFTSKTHNKLDTLIRDSHRFKELKSQNPDYSDDEIALMCFQEMPIIFLNHGKIEVTANGDDNTITRINKTGISKNNSGVAVCIERPDGTYDVAILSGELHNSSKLGRVAETPLEKQAGQDELMNATCHWTTLDYITNFEFTHEVAQEYAPKPTPKVTELTDVQRRQHGEALVRELSGGKIEIEMLDDDGFDETVPSATDDAQYSIKGKGKLFSKKESILSLLTNIGAIHFKDGYYYISKGAKAYGPTGELTDVMQKQNIGQNVSYVRTILKHLGLQEDVDFEIKYPTEYKVGSEDVPSSVKFSLLNKDLDKSNYTDDGERLNVKELESDNGIVKNLLSKIGLNSLVYGIRIEPGNVGKNEVSYNGKNGLLKISGRDVSTVDIVTAIIADDVDMFLRKSNEFDGLYENASAESILSAYENIQDEKEKGIRTHIIAREMAKRIVNGDASGDIKDFINNIKSSRNYGEYVDGLSNVKHKTRRVQTFTAPSGEVYGYVDNNGKIYLDEGAITAGLVVHEATHLWDRTIAQKNPKLWSRGVELMKETKYWKEIEESEDYGKQWKELKMSDAEMEFMIASEVHARLTQEDMNNIEEQLHKEGKSDSFISSLKQWIKDTWSHLKDSFIELGDTELREVTLSDFKNMAIRDIVNGTLKNEVVNQKPTFGKTSIEVDKSNESIVISEGKSSQEEIVEKLDKTDFSTDDDKEQETNRCGNGTDGIQLFDLDNLGGNIDI